ncbi:MAG: amino acid adenylation domain-containing protein [Bacteroidota bacterium]
MQQVDSVVFTSDKYKPYFSFWKQFLEKGVDSFNFRQIQRSNGTFEPLRFSFSFEAQRSDEILKIVNHQDSGVMVMLMVSASIVVSKYSEQSDVIIITPTFGLKHEKRYVEKVPVIIQLNEEQSFRQALVSFQNSIGEFYKYQNFPLSLVDYAALNTKGVFDSNISFEWEGLHDRIQSTGSSADVRIVASRTDRINLLLELNPNAFDASFAENFFSHIDQVLGNVTQLEVKLKDIILGPSQSQVSLLRKFNANRNVSLLQTTLVDTFEQQVLKTPDRTALVAQGSKLTYDELNRKANSLALHLRSVHNVMPGDLVGMMLDRSSALVVAILGILKAGATYVPIDPEYPAERKLFFFHDTQLKLLLTSSEYMFSLPDFDGAIVAMDIQMGEIESEGANLGLTILPEQGAYVIYTSGSTGKPKGVLVPHRGCLNMLAAQISEFEMSERDTTLQFSSISFDASVSEIFKTLFVGGKLVMMDKGLTNDPEKLIAFMTQHSITVATIPPSYLNVLPVEKLKFLRMIISAGEAANIKHAEAFSDFGTYYNAYGPTECSVCVSIEKFDKSRTENKLTIGRPIANMAVHLLTRSGHASPLGLPGEICVSGTGIAHGYLNAPELTAEKFVKNPNHSGDLLYKTGDIGRWLPDGRLEFIGRKDAQVKVRGYRIELPEIEAWALKHADVKEAVCVVREDENQEKQIVLYFTATEDLRASELRKYLEASLPNHMIPSHLVRVNAFHKLPSGKINRRVLPEVSVATTEADYVRPQTELEIKLAEIWAKNLDKSRIGIHDNFFAIGGDSIKAIRLAVDMNKATNLSIEVNDIFSHSTIANLIQNVIKAQKNTETESSTAGEIEKAMSQFKADILANESLQLPADCEDIIPMSDIQKGMIFHSLIGADAGLYKEQMYFQLKDGSFDKKVFNDAVNLMAEKHAILRTSFVMEEGVSAQLIHRFRYRDENLFLEDISAKTKEQQKQYIQKILLEDKYKNLDLKETVLWKLHTFKLSADEYGIMFSCNHALVDGWSNASLMTELSHAYFTLKQGKQFTIQSLKASYRDYVVEQHRISRDASVREFWLKNLHHYNKAPLPFNKVAGGNGGVTNYTFELPERLTRDMVLLSEKGVASLKHLFLAAFSFMLKFSTGENDLTFGLVTNSRPALEDGDKIIGCFTNTVPFRTDVRAGQSALAFVSAIDEQARALKAFDKLSLIEIMKVINEETTGGNPIFDIIFNFVDFHIYENVHQQSEISDGIIDEQPRGNTNTLFDFTVCKSDRHRDKFIVNLNYRSGLYRQSEVDTVFDFYLRILNRIVYQGNEILSAKTLLKETELADILAINDNCTSAPSQTIVERFEQQVLKSPEALALVFGPEEYTYVQLNAKANALAIYLREKYDIKPNDLVGIMARRSASTIIGILGILKAGGAYVPISVEYPAERKKQLLAETGIQVLLTESELMFSLLEFYQGEIFALDIQLDELAQQAENLRLLNNAHDLAYVMFTSGSTGKPKGVMVEHGSVVNLVSQCNYVQFGSNERLLLTGSLSFDATTFEYWSMLLNGGQLHILRDEELLELSRLKACIRENEITMMWLTSAWFNQLVDIDIEIFKPLRCLLVGGDRLSVDHIRRVQSAYPHIRLVNGYGPTETTTFAICHQIDTCNGHTIPIGKPIQNAEIYLLDKDMLPVPQGVSGEIYIGGAGVARGYWRQPSLTKERFIKTKINDVDKVLYRTGDHGKLLGDYTIDFLGRKDNQVKVRGYRIELEEIENVLCKFDRVKEAKVVVKEQENGIKSLVGYVVSKDQIKYEELASFLKTHLPEYMCPDHIVSLDAFPLTANGKVDVKRLPEPGNDRQAENYAAPASETERLMVSVWEGVLGRKQIGIHDNFFMIGGDSIKAIQVSSRLQKEGYIVEVKDIFAYPTISQLSGEARRSTRAIDQSMVTGKMELTPVQANFFEQGWKNRHHFNQSVLLKPVDRFDHEMLDRVFNKLVQHHDILRSVFVVEAEGRYTQLIGPIGRPVAIEVQQLKAETNPVEKMEQLCEEVQRSLNIHQGPLIKAVLFRLPDADRLLIVIHHLIVDGVSWRIILEDLETLLKQSQEGKELLLPMKTDSYIAWSQVQQRYASSLKQSDELRYWQSLIQTESGMLPVKPARQNRISDARLDTVEFSEETTSLFLLKTHQAFNTKANDILLTAVGLALNKTFALKNVMVALEGHGRENISSDVDVSRTVGWFTSIFPVLLTHLNRPGLDKLIKETKENLNRIPLKGIGFGILKYLGQDRKHDLHKLRPGISFNYLGQFDAEVKNTAFTLAEESSGHSVDQNEARIYDLDITGLMLNQKLKFNISYNPAHFDMGVMELFCRNLRTAVEEIIQFCADRGESELTPSDLTHKTISMDMLDSIRQMID